MHWDRCPSVAWDREREDLAAGQLLEELSPNLPIREKALCLHSFWSHRGAMTGAAEPYVRICGTTRRVDEHSTTREFGVKASVAHRSAGTEN